MVVEMESATRTRQGDPLSGVLFAQGHQQALRVLATAFLDCAFPSIADDTNVVGPAARERYSCISLRNSHCSALVCNLQNAWRGPLWDVKLQCYF